jgi:hypothetical protein
MSFPLYTTLSKDLKSKPLTKAAETKLLSNITRLDSKGKELVFALVKAYEKQHSSSDDTTSSFNPFSIPYSGIIKESSITFNLNNFPIPLKNIINTFVIKHIETMKEELEMKKTRDDFSSPVFNSIKNND